MQTMESNPIARVTIEQIKQIEEFKEVTDQECEQIIERMEQLAHLLIEQIQMNNES